MKKLKKMLSFMLSVTFMVVTAALCQGFAVADADFIDAADGKASPDGEKVAELENGGGKVVDGARSLTGDQKIMDNEWFIKHVNKAIVEMKFCGTPIDQILRSGTTNKSDSIIVKYYSVGQRPLKAIVAQEFQSNTTGTPAPVDIEDTNILGEMDTLLVMDKDGQFIMGSDNERPLMIRVNGIDSNTNRPMIYAINGTATSTGNKYIIPTLPAGTVLLRMGRAAAEKDVSTGAYYQLPEPTEQYCQRFIMEVEESVYTRFSKTELDWTFTRMEKMAMEDMRIGIEASGLFGVKGKHIVNKQGLIYTTDGIWYHAGKDLQIGHWENRLDSNGNKIKDAKGQYYLQDLVITEDELIDLVADINEGAGNSSRKKMVFVDKVIYAALCKIKTNNRVRLLEQKDNYMNLGLDFQTYTSMGTTLMFYRHDLFNEWGFEGRAFALDAEYLDKWVFMDWSREEYDLKKLYVRNANAVTMEEFSCWTLSFPDAHARIAIPPFVPDVVA